MGVPRFFKFLAERYPCIISPLNNETIPTFDNLYLDMNGIIHTCTHTDSKIEANISEKDKMLKIFSYIDQLFQMIKPKKYFFMAIDGVAPRAKMNQQRQRRFRSAFEAEKAAENARKNGEQVPQEVFDSNCITPGTEFMVALSKHLQYFIAHKMKTDLQWQQCEIIYSGHDVPGEGEHKIMDFIRKRKMTKGYSPNEKHCLYGLDADLIMLGLVTHEPHFVLLREDVFEQFNYKKGEDKPVQKSFQLLHICMVREYLHCEFKECKVPDSQFDLERVIDDFILICFFCGNDFLPHSPTLDIAEGAIGVLIDTYRALLPKVGYLTNNGEINFSSVEHFIKAVATREEKILLDRYADRKKSSNVHFKTSVTRMEKFISKKGQVKKSIHAKKSLFGVTDEIFASIETDEEPIDQQMAKYEQQEKEDYIDPATSLFLSAEGEMEEEVTEDLVVDENGDEPDEQTKSTDEILFKNVKDGVFNFSGWRAAYYDEKFKVDYSKKEDLISIVKSYIEGLMWVYHYYYNGCVSWKWFYPYSYSPLFTDIADIDIVTLANGINFELGKPFRPFQQLLGVLPPKSAELLPEVYRSLMLSANSPIADMYPSTFHIDREGTKYDYEGVVILPFIDEDRLLEAEKTLNVSKLTKEQAFQNRFGEPYIYKFDANGSFSYPSTLPDLPDLENCPILRTIYKDPSHEPFVPQLCKGVRVGAEGPEGFPSFETKRVESSLKPIGVSILGFPSKKPSITITLPEDDPTRFKSAEDALPLLGQRVNVGYPNPLPAIVTSIADVKCSYYGISQKEIHSDNEKAAFVKELTHHRSVLLRRFGIDIGDSRVLVYCRIFVGMTKDPTGKVKPRFSEPSQEYAYPSELLVMDYKPLHDPKFKTIRTKSISSVYAPKTEVICLDRDHYGCKAEVLSAIEPYDVRLLIQERPKQLPQFPQELSDVLNTTYYSPYQICQKLTFPDGGSPSIKSINILTNYCRVDMVSKDNRANIGLHLRSTKHNKHLLGYTRAKSDKQFGNQDYFLSFGTMSTSSTSKFSVSSVYDWEYSNKALELLQEYLNAFPHVFRKVDSGDARDSTSLFDEEDPEKADAKLEELITWIESKQLKDCRFVPIDSEYLDTNQLQSIEQALIDYEQELSQQPAKVVTVVPVKCVYRPPDPNYLHMIDESALRIGHRVVHIRKEGHVPFGLTGVICGIESDKAQVLFDCPFIGGSTFKDQLKTTRGQMLPKSYLLNLSVPSFASPDKVSNHFEKSRTMEDRTTYQSMQYYDVKHKPQNGIVDISHISRKTAPADAPFIRVYQQKKTTNKQPAPYTLNVKDISDKVGAKTKPSSSTEQADVKELEARIKQMLKKDNPRGQKEQKKRYEHNMGTHQDDQSQQEKKHPENKHSNGKDHHEKKHYEKKHYEKRHYEKKHRGKHHQSAKQQNDEAKQIAHQASMMVPAQVSAQNPTLTNSTPPTSAINVTYDSTENSASFNPASYFQQRVVSIKKHRVPRHQANRGAKNEQAKNDDESKTTTNTSNEQEGKKKRRPRYRGKKSNNNNNNSAQNNNPTQTSNSTQA